MCKSTKFAQFVERDSDTIKIMIDGQIETYEYLKIIEFTSDRKKMSVVVKRLSDGIIFNFVKGADNVMIKALSR
jgi:magnesium-transporting ATPase (P-type)